MDLYLQDRDSLTRERIPFDPGQKPLGRGGAGLIYPHPSRPDTVLKVYHADFLARHGHRLRNKLDAMLVHAPREQWTEAEGKRYVQIAWPEACLETENGTLAGYSMPLVDLAGSVMLEQVLQHAERQREHIREDYLFRVYIAYNLAGVVRSLHEKGHGVIDLKPVNLHVYRDNGLVCLLDCDGFAIRGSSGVIYPSELFTPEYLYPDGHGRQPDQVESLAQDHFALAVILFQLLNNGLHPYQGIPLDPGVPSGLGERIVADLYSYGQHGHPRQSPAPQTMHTFLERGTRTLFDRAFTRDRKTPDAGEWERHLEQLIDHRLRPCKRNPEHWQFSRGCGWCALEARRTAAHPTPPTPSKTVSTPDPATRVRQRVAPAITALPSGNPWLWRIGHRLLHMSAILAGLGVAVMYGWLWIEQIRWYVRIMTPATVATHRSGTLPTPRPLPLPSPGKR
jgi:DNA-binding helix-hairpin-helix protein with protein kinase domain